jgi:hypothetical protein
MEVVDRSINSFINNELYKVHEIDSNIDIDKMKIEICKQLEDIVCEIIENELNSVDDYLIFRS